MSRLNGWWHRVRVLFSSSRYSRELEEEFAFHQSLETMQQSRQLSPPEAARAARRRFGNDALLTEETRLMAGLALLDTIAQDLRFAIRTFRRTPMFTAVVILTLAIGLGANTAIFSAVNAMLLRPLPFVEPDRLMDITVTIPAGPNNPGRDNMPWSYPKFVAFRDVQRSFSSIGIYSSSEITLRADGEAERITTEVANDGYLQTLGIAPQRGRNFLPEEELSPGGPKVALISDQLWNRRFNADPAVLGRSISLGGDPYTIVGVLPRGFRGMTGRADAVTSLLALSPEELNEPWSHFLTMVGRLKPGVEVDRARSEVAEAGTVVDRTYPNQETPTEHWGATTRPLNATRVDPLIRRSLLILLGAVGLVLLIACANVANLFLIRAASRRREIAVRLAIGAGRGRLVRQLLAECLLLSVTGGLIGLLLAWWGVHLLSSLNPASAFADGGGGGIGAINFAGIRLDGAAFGFAALLALVTGVTFGMLPALQATRPVLSEALKDGDGRSGTAKRRLSSRSALAIVEISLALVLLAGSGLMIRSLARLLDVDPGFEGTHLLTLRLNTREGFGRDSLPAFYDQMQSRLSGVPGVAGAGLTDCLPLSGGCNGTVIWFRDRPAATPGTEPAIGVHWITPNWPTLMGVPLIKGRLFDASDRLGSRKAVLLSRTAAEKFWPGQDAIGRPVGIGQGGFQDTAYVVGVVGDVRFASVDSPPMPEAYLSYYQSPRGRMTLVIQGTTRNPLELTGSVRSALKELAPDFPVYDVRSMAERTADALAYVRFSTLLLSLFAAMALALATMGTYGVIAYAAAQRKQEIGIRMALGATRRDVLRLVVGQGLGIAVAGTVIGLTAALAATRVLEALLYQTAPSDPATLVTIVAVLLLAVLAASWLPARRAATIQPTEALRG